MSIESVPTKNVPIFNPEDFIPPITSTVSATQYSNLVSLNNTVINQLALLQSLVTNYGVFSYYTTTQFTGYTNQTYTIATINITTPQTVMVSFSIGLQTIGGSYVVAVLTAKNNNGKNLNNAYNVLPNTSVSNVILFNSTFPFQSQVSDTITFSVTITANAPVTTFQSYISNSYTFPPGYSKQTNNIRLNRIK